MLISWLVPDDGSGPDNELMSRTEIFEASYSLGTVGAKRYIYVDDDTNLDGLEKWSVALSSETEQLDDLSSTYPNAIIGEDGKVFVPFVVEP